MPYTTPPADLIPIVDAPPPPSVSMAPGGRYLALVHYAAHPEIALLARELNPKQRVVVRLVDAQLVEQSAKLVPVLGPIDGLGTGA